MLGCPTARHAQRRTVTVPTTVASARVCPRSSRQPARRKPPGLAGRGQRGFLPIRAQVQVILQQLAQQFAASAGDQVFQRVMGIPGGPSAFQISDKGVERLSRRRKGASTRGDVIRCHRGLFFTWV